MLLVEDEICISACFFFFHCVPGPFEWIVAQCVQLIN
jgi:hypothetical protein